MLGELIGMGTFAAGFSGGGRGGTGAFPTAAHSPVQAGKLVQELAIQEHIDLVQAQLGEMGHVIAGGPIKTSFRSASIYAEKDGGVAADWAKLTSTSSVSREGISFETHWVQNMRTGQRLEFETKYNGGSAGIWFQ